MIQPGLERISLLLKDINFPWKAIHVAGTNGKGSICATASHLLTRRNIRNGRFTSPHVVDRWDCIAINGKTVDEKSFRRVEAHFSQLNKRENIEASEFELLTAAAFQLFNDENVKVGVVEVGMGGKLDATNILNNQVVSVISKIARDHENFLGTSVEQIALHKAGILRPNVPYVINPINEWNVHNVIAEYAREIGAGPLVHGDTKSLMKHLFASVHWRKFAYDFQAFQRDNAVLAYLAVVEAMKSMKLDTKKVREMLPGIRNTVYPGRFHHLNVRSVFGNTNNIILTDGAHNVDAATALDQYVARKIRKPANVSRDVYISTNLRVTWVIAMTDGKDAFNYLGTLLKPGDNIITTTFGPVDGMPWVKPMNAEDLLQVAKKACPGIVGFSMPTAGVFRALCAAKYMTSKAKSIVVTGSLYLVGDLLREKVEFTKEPNEEMMRSMEMTERHRVNSFLSEKLDELENVAPKTNPPPNSNENADLDLKLEIDSLERELDLLERGEISTSEARVEEGDEVLRHNFMDELEHTLSGSDHPSLNQRFFNEFEDIRKQLQKLPRAQSVTWSGLPPNSTALHDPLDSIGRHSTLQDPIGRPLEEPKVPKHYSASSPDESPFSRRGRDFKVFRPNTSGLEPVQEQDSISVVANNMLPISSLIRPHYANYSPGEKMVDRINGKTFPVQPQPLRRLKNIDR
ncbi:FolC bifunctional protein [Pleomassaria siparia CBS 279.74]|uniref:FolC bifunctional protein n=1 Tax=Pleomassaria siparia CBS 279.74 TaxID=1314801 RepID=A0A6G1K3I5_9PLEO|nr:FolC bifunctional protein [Pleomassaria siparia CBS 279.74]